MNDHGFAFDDGRHISPPRIVEVETSHEERFNRAMDVGLRYKRERDEAREQLKAMTAARDLCKRQIAEASERWQTEMQGREALLAEFLIWVDAREGGPTLQIEEAAQWVAHEFLTTRRP